MSLYSSAMVTSAMTAALSIMSRVTFPFWPAKAHRTPGMSVEVSPRREQIEKKARRSNMRSLLRIRMAAHYKLRGLNQIQPGGDVMTFVGGAAWFLGMWSLGWSCSGMAQAGEFPAARAGDFVVKDFQFKSGERLGELTLH